MRRRWEADLDTPVFSQDRDYINRFVYLDREKLLVQAFLEAKQPFVVDNTNPLI
ncbi:hypothetical protein [Saccharibacillus sacchari]|uniref:Uncharacterized protein n=1 Tax=Saccharibacillus sacchari TaxID=456493 RepID=A0ACC6P9R2_9BACL